MADTERINEILKSQGFEEFKWVDASEIMVAQWVRVKCLFGCSEYGSGACPPNTPLVEECKSFFSEYQRAVIVVLKKHADKKNYPSDWSKQMTKNLLEVERQIFLSGYYKIFLLNQTCCSLCKDCKGNRNDCANKKDSRPSPEAFAVDVYETLRNANIDINVVAENPGGMKRIAILMID